MEQTTGRDINGEIRPSQRSNFKYSTPEHLMSPRSPSGEKEAPQQQVPSFLEYLFSSPLLLLSIAAILGLAVGYLFFSPEVITDVIEEAAE